MSGNIEFEGRTEQDAIESACVALNIHQSDLDYTVIDGGSVGLFGFGARPVRIRAEPRHGAKANTSEEYVSEEAKVDEATPRAPLDPETEAAKIAKTQEVAAALAEKMGMQARITVTNEEERIVVLVEEEEGSTAVAEILGGSRPPAAPSFQFLLNKIVNRFPEDRKHIVVEAPSAAEVLAKRQPRQRSATPKSNENVELPEDIDPELAELAKFLAARANEMNKVITIHPMAAGDRRAIHQTVTLLSDAETVSEGEGLYRRMHIVPASMKRPSRKRRRRRRRRPGEGDESGAEANQEASAETGGEAETPPASEPAPVDGSDSAPAEESAATS